jgi:hypothetical protein
MMID